MVDINRVLKCSHLPKPNVNKVEIKALRQLITDKIGSFLLPIQEYKSTRVSLFCLKIKCSNELFIIFFELNT